MPLFDNLFTGTILELYSDRLVKMLEEAGIRFEIFPARVVEASTGKKVKVNYRIFHLLEKYPALDKKLSDIDDETGDIRKLVISKKYLRLKKPLFRIEGAEDIVLIHRELKDLLESQNITGCEYTLVDEYRSSIDSYFNQLDGES